MSLWALIVFALCMLLGVAGFGAVPQWPEITRPVFVLSAVVLAVAVVLGGLRRPVV